MWSVMTKDYSVFQKGLETMPDEDFEDFIIMLQDVYGYTDEDIETIRHNRKLQKEMGGT